MVPSAHTKDLDVEAREKNKNTRWGGGGDVKKQTWPTPRLPQLCIKETFIWTPIIAAVASFFNCVSPLYCKTDYIITGPPSTKQILET